MKFFNKIFVGIESFLYLCTVFLNERRAKGTKKA